MFHSSGVCFIHHHQAFQTLDVDGSGFISVGNLRQALDDNEDPINKYLQAICLCLFSQTMCVYIYNYVHLFFIVTHMYIYIYVC